MPKKAKIVRFARSALVLKVTLQEVRPPIWRRLRVAGDLTLRELHHVLQIAMGWTDSHPHEFEIDDRRYGMPDAEEDLGKPALDELDHPLYRLLREGVRAEYVYDFGDGAVAHATWASAGVGPWHQERADVLLHDVPVGAGLTLDVDRARGAGHWAPSR